MASEWAPISIRWPEQASQWMSGMGATAALAEHELQSTVIRVSRLESIAITNPGPVGAAAEKAIQIGRQALAEQFDDAPTCLVVTPFQSGIGQGRGSQRFLSAPNLLQVLANKLTDATDLGRAHGSRYALCLLFLATRYDQLAASLARFNALMPLPELVRAERRAGQLAKLEAEKWHIPKSRPIPCWQLLPLERCSVMKAALQSMAGKLSVLEGYAADSSPMADLGALATRKAEQHRNRDQQLKDLQRSLEDQRPDSATRAKLIGPGNATELRRLLLEHEAPGHEWVICAGALLVGSEKGLSFVRELVGL